MNGLRPNARGTSRLTFKSPFIQSDGTTACESSRSLTDADSKYRRFANSNLDLFAASWTTRSQSQLSTAQLEMTILLGLTSDGYTCEEHLISTVSMYALPAVDLVASRLDPQPSCHVDTKTGRQCLRESNSLCIGLDCAKAKLRGIPSASNHKLVFTPSKLPDFTLPRIRLRF